MAVISVVLVKHLFDRSIVYLSQSELVVINGISISFQSPDCNDRVQVQRLLLNCPDIGKHRELYIKQSSKLKLILHYSYIRIHILVNQ